MDCYPDIRCRLRGGRQVDNDRRKRAAGRTESDSVLQPAIRRKRRRWAHAVDHLPQRLEAVQTKKTDPQTVAYTACIGGDVGRASAVADVPRY